MPADAVGVEVPLVDDPFDPQGDMVALAASLHGLLTIPVPNAAGRVTLLSALAAAGLSPSPTTPVTVARADTGMTERNSGSGWVRLSDGPLAVLASGAPADKALVAASTVDLIASGDSGGIPSVTLDPGGRVCLDLTFQYLATTSSVAASADLTLLIDGTVQPGAWQIHTGLGATANVQKPIALSLTGWATPGAHTINARLTHTGNGGISVALISYRVRG